MWRRIYGAIEWLRRPGYRAYRTMRCIRGLSIQVLYWMSDAYIEITVFCVAVLCAYIAIAWL